MIVGIGCDVVDTRRVEKLLTKHGESFLNKILSPSERERFEAFEKKSKTQISFLAKRFAAKEAVSKAFGTGIGKELSFFDITVQNNELGAPFVTLPEEFSFNGHKGYKIQLSLSDEWPIAVAFAIVSK